MKKLMFALSMVMAIIFLVGCTNGLDMKSVHNEPHFAGVVLEVFDGSILVKVNEGEAIRNSSDLIFVSLDVYLADSITDFMSGDEVVVFFDGTIMETYPAQVNTVYAIMLTSPSKTSVWHNAIGMVIYHTKDGHTSASGFRERSRIDEFLNWLTRMTLVRISSQDSENLNIEAFAEVYEFAMRTSAHFSWDEENEFTAHDDGDIFVFHYGRIGGAWYLLFGGVWYEVKNPSNIIFPIKHEPVIFQPVVIPESQHETGTATTLSFTLEEWYGGADTAMELIYEDENYGYYLTSIRSHLIMLTFEDGNRLTLADAIVQSKVSIEDLKLSGLDLVAISRIDSTERAINREWAHDLEDVPGRSPQLYVGLSTVGLQTQNFRAAQGSTSWFLVYDASAEHPLDFWRETWDCIDFNAFIGQFEGVGSGEIELRFSHFPPDTMYVRRWRTEFIGMASEMWNIYEPVEVNDNIIRVNDSGYDYIYQVEARWERGGWASYTFRINSAR
jgi:hypothetical protein